MFRLLSNFLNSSAIIWLTRLNHQDHCSRIDQLLISKCLNSIGPKYIADFLNVRDVCYNLRGKGSNLVQPYFATDWMHKSFSFIASKL